MGSVEKELLRGEIDALVRGVAEQRFRHVAGIEPAPDLTSRFADLTCLPFPDRSQESISCMHVVEHVGLGRYGDPLDPDGDLKAMAELQRVVAQGGHLLFVVPVGKPRICFNSHRTYSYDQVLAGFPELQLSQFALIPDNPSPPKLLLDADPALVKEQEFGCGCFHFQRPV